MLEVLACSIADSCIQSLDCYKTTSGALYLGVKALLTSHTSGLKVKDSYTLLCPYHKSHLVHVHFTYFGNVTAKQNIRSSFTLAVTIRKS